MTTEQAVDNLVNGNISIFKAWLKRASKLQMLDAIEYYSGNVGGRHIIIYTMHRYLRENNGVYKEHNAMTKRERMYEQIFNHGVNLNRIFGLDLDPIKLSKKIHSLEVKAHRLTEDYCNGLLTTDELSKICDKSIFAPLDRILGFTAKQIPVFINNDARGYALKINDDYAQEHQLNIFRDLGGYGILAPEFDGKA